MNLKLNILDNKKGEIIMKEKENFKKIRLNANMTIEEVAMATGYSIDEVIDFEESNEYIQLFHDLVDFYMDLWIMKNVEDFDYDWYVQEEYDDYFDKYYNNYRKNFLDDLEE